MLRVGWKAISENTPLPVDSAAGLEFAHRNKRETRDLSLGYLALAESDLQAGDLPASRASAIESSAITVAALRRPASR